MKISSKFIDFKPIFLYKTLKTKRVYCFFPEETTEVVPPEEALVALELVLPPRETTDLETFEAEVVELLLVEYPFVELTGFL